MQIDDEDEGGEIEDVQMKMVRKHRDRSPNHQAAPRQNGSTPISKASKTVLGRRSFDIAFESNDEGQSPFGQRVRDSAVTGSKCHLSSGYQIKVPLFKKQRI